MIKKEKQRKISIESIIHWYLLPLSHESTTISRYRSQIPHFQYYRNYETTLDPILLDRPSHLFPRKQETRLIRTLFRQVSPVIGTLGVVAQLANYAQRQYSAVANAWIQFNVLLAPWISDLDTMLYGYTNNIYVLDHTPESLPVSTISSKPVSRRCYPPIRPPLCSFV